MNDEITFSTFNVRGIRNPNKRNNIINFLKQHKVSVASLQETHCNSDIEAGLWFKDDFYNDYIYDNLSSNSCGIATLINNCKVKLKHKKTLLNGRLLLSLIELDNYDLENIALINVYCPALKKEKVNFLKDMVKEVKDWLSTNNINLIILGADFNCVLNSIDRSNVDISRGKYDQSTKVLEEFMNELNLIDIWRKTKPDKRQFTWRQICTTKDNVDVVARLDRWLISDSLLGYIEKCYITPCILSDHLPVMLKFRNLKQIPRGRGLWKFNDSLLKESNFCQDVERFWYEWIKRKPNLPSLR